MDLIPKPRDPNMEIEEATNLADHHDSSLCEFLDHAEALEDHSTMCIPTFREFLSSQWS
jgi:hypothetical protein